MKLAPVVRGLRAHPHLTVRIVHTGQHYDPAMTDIFFRDLGIPAPDVHLDVGSGTHGVQTARIIERYETHLMERRPHGTVVFGDVNSTVACALAAVKLGIPVAHVEAGLRSFDRTMPEEINRLLTDAMADLLLVSEPSGVTNLQREGVDDSKIRLVGNVMIDSLFSQLPVARSRGAAAALGLDGRRYGFVTLHRPSNVDDPAMLGELLRLLHELAEQLPLVFAVHPRTRSAVSRMGLDYFIGSGQRDLICVGPQSYIDTVSLVSGAGRRPHRFRRPSGRKFGAGRSVSHTAREHGTAGHGDARNEPIGRQRPHAHPISVHRRARESMERRPTDSVVGRQGW